MLVLLLIYTIVLLDQGTKYVVRAGLDWNESRTVLDGFFSLTYVGNTGAAWGMFGGQNVALAALSIAMGIGIVLFRRALFRPVVTHRVAMGLLLGGIVGNLLDRVRLFYVVDFLDFYFRSYHFPAFNVADAAICGGVLLYVVSSFWIGGSEAGDTIAAGAGSSVR